MGFAPGFQQLTSGTPRMIFPGEVKLSRSLIPGGITIRSTARDPGNNPTHEIRAGWVMGKVTASGLWRPCPRTQVNMTGATATEIVVDNSLAFVVGDVITIGGDTDLTITAINYSTHTLTIASTTVADNEPVFVQDGSATCRGILASQPSVWDPDKETYVDIPGAELVVSGPVKQSMVLGDLAAILAVESTMKIEHIEFVSGDTLSS